jgi:hypothetical protein
MPPSKVARLHGRPLNLFIFNCSLSLLGSRKGCLGNGILLLSCVQQFAHQMTKVLRFPF